MRHFHNTAKKMRASLGSFLKSPYTYVSLLALILIIWQGVYLRALFVDVSEDVMYAFFPSAQRAFDYGEVHFTVTDPADYDIDRAQTYFLRAAALDPDMFYVYHQLARISFLEGDFPKAMAQINVQIQNHGDAVPASYYVRGLIEGYMGDYADAETDYGHFLKLEPGSWAGLNDYAWVLLKDNKPREAAAAATEGLTYDPYNPWLLNSAATAFYEMGDIPDAKAMVLRASASVANLTPDKWSLAYPGNNPDVAQEGVDTFKKAVADNMHTILAASTSLSH